MVCIDFFKKNSSKILPCVYFIRLGGRQRRVVGEKGAMEQKSLRNTGVQGHKRGFESRVLGQRDLTILQSFFCRVCVCPVHDVTP